MSEGAARLPSATEAVEDAVEGDLNESLTILQEALSGEEEADGDAIEMARLLDGALNDSTGLNLGDVVSGAAEGEAHGRTRRDSSALESLGRSLSIRTHSLKGGVGLGGGSRKRPIDLDDDGDDGGASGSAAAAAAPVDLTDGGAPSGSGAGSSRDLIVVD